MSAEPKQQPKIPLTNSPGEAAYCALWNARHASSCKRESIMFIGLAVSAMDKITDRTMQELLTETIAETQVALGIRVGGRA